jgi:hypothetical protein
MLGIADAMLYQRTASGLTHTIRTAGTGFMKIPQYGDSSTACRKKAIFCMTVRFGLKSSIWEQLSVGSRLVKNVKWMARCRALQDVFGPHPSFSYRCERLRSSNLSRCPSGTRLHCSTGCTNCRWLLILTVGKLTCDPTTLNPTLFRFDQKKF